MKVVQLDISKIKVGEDRQRKGLGEEEGKAKVAFDELVRSMDSHGLLQPVGVDEHNQLIYGFRRVEAAKRLQWTQIAVLYREDIEHDELLREELELEENATRLDLSWSERNRAIARLDALRTKRNPTHTQTKTAQELGITQGKVSEAVMLEKMMSLFPEIANAKTKKQAMSLAKNKAKAVTRHVEVAANPERYKSITEKVVCAKAEEHIITMADGEAGRLILTDGPFGIGYDKRQAGVEGGHAAYEDSPESYRERTASMAPHLYRVLPDDGFLVWFLGHDHFEWTKETFRKAGFAVDPVPLAWNRSDGRNYTARPDRWFGKAYDIALHCIKGNPEVVVRGRPNGNVFTFKPVATVDKEHIVERPIELYQELIRCLTVQGEKVTDFFGGSGKVAAAAASLKRNHFTVEADAQHIPTIVNNIFANTPTPDTKSA